MERINIEDAEKELKWLKRIDNRRLCEWREKTQFLKRQIKISYLKGYTNSG